MNDIYEMLRSGRSADEIAKEFAKSLNEAEEKVRKEDEERKARAAEQKARDEKRTELKDAMVLFISWFKKYYPEYAESEDLNFGDEELNSIVELIDSLLDLEKIKASFSFGPFGATTSRVFEKPKTKEPAKEATRHNTTPDDIFSSFFQSLGL